MSIITTGTCGIRTGGRLSGRPTPTARSPSGSGSTGTSGPSGSVRRSASSTRQSTTASVLVPTPGPSADLQPVGSWGGGELLLALVLEATLARHSEDLRAGYVYDLSVRRFEVSDTRDFGIGRRVCADNWRALRSVGENANRRLCDAQAQDARPAPDVVTLAQVTRPSTTPEGLHAPALCFGDPRVMAILAALLLFCHVVAGFRNRDLVKLVSSLLDQPYSGRQATYDLRRLRRKGLIARLPHSQRYQLTALGRRVAVLFTKAHGRVLAPGLALLDPALPLDIAARSPLGQAWRRLDHALDDFVASRTSH